MTPDQLAEVSYFTTGETDWAKSGRFTGATEIELTRTGAAQISSSAATLIGPGKLIDRYRLARIFVSPRVRAVRTFELLLPSLSDVDARKVIYTEDIAEWDYGDYEGLRSEEIKLSRKNRGLDTSREWNIWSDGCEGGEYVALWICFSPPPSSADYLTGLCSR